MQPSTSDDRSRPAVVKFVRAKYGRELLVDAGWVRQLSGFITNASPHVLTFHELLLVTRGRGTVLLDGNRLTVAPGVILLVKPGQVRAWEVKGTLDGACLLFVEDFISDAFADPRFLDRFPLFLPARTSTLMNVGAAERREFRVRFETMRQEIIKQRDDVSHRLRATLYDLLVLLNRWYVARFPVSPSPSQDGRVERFCSLVDRDFRSQHRVSHYAVELGCTPGHLNHLCRTLTGRNAGSIIRSRIALEARRLLMQTDLSARHIAYQLGFDDASYFSRFLRRESGEAPSRLRLKDGCNSDRGLSGRTGRPSPLASPARLRLADVGD